MPINLWRYTAIYTGLAIGMLILSVVVDIAFSYDLPSAVVNFIPLMGAAMYEGQRYARKHSAKIPGPAAWKAALVMTEIDACVTLVLFFLLALISNPLPALDSTVMAILGLILLFVFITTLLLNRWFLAIGAGTELKAIARRAKNSG